MLSSFVGVWENSKYRLFGGSLRVTHLMQKSLIYRSHLELFSSQQRNLLHVSLLLELPGKVWSAEAKIRLTALDFYKKINSTISVDQSDCDKKILLGSKQASDLH